MSDKPKFPAALAMGVAEELIARMAPACERICFAGSLRRRKAEVGDVELLYVSRFESVVDTTDLFGGRVLANLADEAIAALEKDGTLVRRKNINGSETFGEKIKLMRHAASGIPIDLFATREESWANYLVCRTGPAEQNVRICVAAIARGYKWEPYTAGFRRIGHTVPMHSEEDVFRFVGMPYRAPEDRT